MGGFAIRARHFGRFPREPRAASPMEPCSTHSAMQNMIHLGFLLDPPGRGSPARGRAPVARRAWLRPPRASRSPGWPGRRRPSPSPAPRRWPGCPPASSRPTRRSWCSAPSWPSARRWSPCSTAARRRRSPAPSRSRRAGCCSAGAGAAWSPRRRPARWSSSALVEVVLGVALLLVGWYLRFHRRPIATGCTRAPLSGGLLAGALAAGDRPAPGPRRARRHRRRLRGPPAPAGGGRATTPARARGHASAPAGLVAHGHDRGPGRVVGERTCRRCP